MLGPQTAERVTEIYTHKGHPEVRFLACFYVQDERQVFIPGTIASVQKMYSIMKPYLLRSSERETEFVRRGGTRGGS